jgi:mono/diheme cytochrome c family protein
MDIDLGSGGLSLLPSLSEGSAGTPDLLVLGGKQGNVYLVDRTAMPGRLDRRQPCSTDSSTDQSLMPPVNQPQFGKRGPLNVFGPYTETHAAMNMARSRSVPAFFKDEEGESYIFVTGATMREEELPVRVPPSLVRLKVIESGQAPYLETDQVELSMTFANPGSPMVTSNGSRDAIVWVLDTNAERSAALFGPDMPEPVLYAFDALSLKLLWQSASGELRPGGKYNQPAFARGNVFVGTDRIQSFGLGRPSIAREVANHRAGGSKIYQQRCAACHDQPDGRIPPKVFLARLPPTYISNALTAGSMRAQAEGLNSEEIEAVAQYLTGPVSNSTSAKP